MHPVHFTVMAIPNYRKRVILFALSSIIWVARNLILLPVVENQLLTSNVPDYHAVISFNSQSADELQHSTSYIESIKSFKRRLEFLHIPKTAGSTIEEIIALRQANLSWGMCRFPRGNYSDPRLPCYGMQPNWFVNNETQSSSSHLVPWEGFPSFWHTPPHLFRPEDNPYQNADLFTVIRDPLDRAMSEYHYQCFMLLRDRPKKLCREGPTAYYERKMRNLTRSRPGLRYRIDDSHLTPQYEYIVRPLDVRQVDYILVLDPTSVGRHFNLTVWAFDLQLYWPGADKRAENAVNRSKHKVNPLADHMVELLQRYYANDYSLFQ